MPRPNDPPRRVVPMLDERGWRLAIGGSFADPPVYELWEGAEEAMARRRVLEEAGERARLETTMKPYYEANGITIYHADCREVLPILSGVDAVVTDPPYGIKKAEWDSEVPLWAIPFIEAVLLPGGSLYWFGVPPHIYEVQRRSSLTFKRELYWWFDTGYPTERNYRIATETILFLTKGEKPSYFCDDHIRESYQTNRPGGRRTHNPRGKSPGNVIYMPRPAPGHQSENEHVSAKPEELVERLILTSCKPGGIVLDPFMGSGTTLRAAKNLGRRAIGIEIEERYCEIAARRLAQEVLAFAEDPA